MVFTEEDIRAVAADRYWRGRRSRLFIWAAITACIMVLILSLDIGGFGLAAYMLAGVLFLVYIYRHRNRRLEYEKELLTEWNNRVSKVSEEMGKV